MNKTFYHIMSLIASITVTLWNPLLTLLLKTMLFMQYHNRSVTADCVITAHEHKEHKSTSYLPKSCGTLDSMIS